MGFEEYLKSIGISNSGTIGDDGSYVIQLNTSNEFGKMFTKLDSVDDIEQLEDNQVITEQGSSLMYQSSSEPYLLNLLADFNNNVYQLVVTKIE